MKRYIVNLENVEFLFKKDLPSPVVNKLLVWAKQVEIIGLSEMRKISGYHDEPLRGDRAGQRSIRLNRSYRAIYVMNELENIITIIVIEVHKHEY